MAAMMRRILTLIAFLAGAGQALACPDSLAAPVERHAATGRQLWSPDVHAVRAGGEHQILFCGFGRHGLVRGAPDFAFDLTRMERYDRLHVRANADCDTVLLLLDPLGRWHFDDDSGTGRTASLSLAGPVSGEYLVWVGSYEGRGCQARLTLETF